MDLLAAEITAVTGKDPGQHLHDLVAEFGAADTERLLADPNIVRNRLKIGAAIDNARAFLRVQDEFGEPEIQLRKVLA